MTRIRSALVLTFLMLLALAAVTRRETAAGQGAVPLSRPGQEDLSFWVNHNGLLQFDVEGELGFGDMARILLRRRANGEQIRELRDRFTFRVQDPAALLTSELFRVECAKRCTTAGAKLERKARCGAAAGHWPARSQPTAAIRVAIFWSSAAHSQAAEAQSPAAR